MVYDNINLGRRIDPVWPEAEWRAKGGRNSWNNWIPMEEMKGVVLHRYLVFLCVTYKILEPLKQKNYM